jgi:predicted DNA-binding ArsR family transcriptional regulator
LEDLGSDIKNKQIKELLKDWMNANGWENSIGDNDFEYMKNMGENKWSYESDEKNNDGTYKIYYFLFDPTKMTFKEL